MGRLADVHDGGPAGGDACVRGRVYGPMNLAAEAVMEGLQPERPDRQDGAVWLRIAVIGLMACLLLYGCWQAFAWFAAHFPKDFR